MAISALYFAFIFFFLSLYLIFSQVRKRCWKTESHDPLHKIPLLCHLSHSNAISEFISTKNYCFSKINCILRRTTIALLLVHFLEGIWQDSPSMLFQSNLHAETLLLLQYLLLPWREVTSHRDLNPLYCEQDNLRSISLVPKFTERIYFSYMVDQEVLEMSDKDDIRFKINVIY